ncbi:MAG: TolC family protein [Bacteroidales bacterium]|nr:TolC family protein [Bacteroidales bacterium]MBD5378071.1 TolC family protein [Bacteroides sp.]
MKLVVAAGLSITLLGSCNIYKKYELPVQESALIEQYGKALEQPEDSTAFGNLDWRQVFTDPVLQDLIAQALENNVNLENAKLNVDIANAQLRGAKLNYLPSVALAPTGSGAKFQDGGAWSWSYTIPAQVNWEIDIFAKLLNAKRGAKAGLLQSQAYEQAVRSQVIAGVANCYYSIAMLESQLQLSRATAENWRQSVEVMKNLKEAGRLNESAVVQSRAQYYGILASITDLETSLAQANNTMSLLLGVMPQKWTVTPGAYLSAPAGIDTAVPMRALASRPDVAAAEQSLAVAYYATNSARAAFYPGLNITANGGFTNSLGSMIVNPGKWFINLGASLVAPLFSRGANIAGLQAAKARQQQALNNFEHTIMSAAADVSDALTAYENSRTKASLLAEQTQNLEKSVEYTQELLTLGTSTYLEVLTAQTNLLSSQMGELSCRLASTQAVINLYQNLGGGR